MSSLQPAEFESLRVGYSCQMIATAFIFYDFILITEDEIRLFWRKKLTGATVLFWLNKWLVIAYYAIAAVSYLKIPDTSCGRLMKVISTFEFSMYLVWGSFTALRTYALSRNWFLATTIFLLYAVTVGVNMSRFRFGLIGINIPIIHCVESNPIPVELVKMFTILSRASLILANCLATGVTWFTMRRDHGFSYVGESGRRTLAGVLLWDGFIYFITLAIMDTLHMTITLLSIEQFIANNVSELTLLSDPLTAILMSHFMLHLQRAAQRTSGPEVTSSQESTLNVGSLMFERALGSLGASISPEDYVAIGENRGDDSVEGGLSPEGGAWELENLARE